MATVTQAEPLTRTYGWTKPGTGGQVDDAHRALGRVLDGQPLVLERRSGTSWRRAGSITLTAADEADFSSEVTSAKSRNRHYRWSSRASAPGPDDVERRGSPLHKAAIQKIKAKTDAVRIKHRETRC